MLEIGDTLAGKGSHAFSAKQNSTPCSSAMLLQCGAEQSCGWQQVVWRIGDVPAGKTRPCLSQLLPLPPLPLHDVSSTPYGHPAPCLSPLPLVSLCLTPCENRTPRLPAWPLAVFCLTTRQPRAPCQSTWPRDGTKWKAHLLG